MDIADLSTFTITSTSVGTNVGVNVGVAQQTTTTTFEFVLAGTTISGTAATGELEIALGHRFGLAGRRGDRSGHQQGTARLYGRVLGLDRERDGNGPGLCPRNQGPHSDQRRDSVAGRGRAGHHESDAFTITDQLGNATVFQLTLTDAVTAGDVDLASRPAIRPRRSPRRSRRPSTRPCLTTRPRPRAGCHRYGNGPGLRPRRPPSFRPMP